MSKPKPLKNKMKTMIGANPLPKFNFFFVDDVKSAIQGLIEDINSSYGCVHHQGGNNECIICIAIGQTLNEVQRKIKKWFPDVVNKDV